jgi:3-dehydroquinate synthase
MGRARPLDFGHWAAHKLEALSGYEIRHGQAVAIGVALDSQYAFLKGWLIESEMDDIHAGLADAGFLLWHPLLEQHDADGRLAVLRGLDDFREHLGGELCITFPQGIGRKREASEMDMALIERAIAALKAAAQQAVPHS